MERVYAELKNRKGEVIAYGAVDDMGHGVGDVWIVMGEEAKRNPLALCRILRETANEARRRFNLRSLQALVDPDDPVAVRFAERFGFTWEGRLLFRPTGPRDIYAMEWGHA